MIYKPIFNLYCKNDLCSDDSIDFTPNFIQVENFNIKF